MYIYNTKIRLFHTDAGNLIFFSRLFDIAYECYEEFLEKSEFGVKKILNDNKFHIPVVHTEADYIKPLRIGDKIEIRMSLNSSGKSSFTLVFVLFNELGEKTARVKTVNVVIEAKSGNPIKIPEKFLKILNSLNI
jgi:YbgC/YbaW family acyl-CoA thioester hydrolase